MKKEIKIKLKRCPVCNSSRVTQSKNGFECKRCGYVNKEFKEKTFS